MRNKNRLRKLVLALVLLAVVVVAGLALFRSGDDFPAPSADLATRGHRCPWSHRHRGGRPLEECFTTGDRLKQLLLEPFKFSVRSTVIDRAMLEARSLETAPFSRTVISGCTATVTPNGQHHPPLRHTRSPLCRAGACPLPVAGAQSDSRSLQGLASAG